MASTIGHKRRRRPEDGDNDAMRRARHSSDEYSTDKKREVSAPIESTIESIATPSVGSDATGPDATGPVDSKLPASTPDRSTLEFHSTPWSRVVAEKTCLIPPLIECIFDYAVTVPMLETSYSLPIVTHKDRIDRLAAYIKHQWDNPEYCARLDLLFESATGNSINNMDIDIPPYSIHQGVFNHIRRNRCQSMIGAIVSAAFVQVFDSVYPSDRDPNKRRTILCRMMGEWQAVVDDLMTSYTYGDKKSTTQSELRNFIMRGNFGSATPNVYNDPMIYRRFPIPRYRAGVGLERYSLMAEECLLTMSPFRVVSRAIYRCFHGAFRGQASAAHHIAALPHRLVGEYISFLLRHIHILRPWLLWGCVIVHRCGTRPFVGSRRCRTECC